MGADDRSLPPRAIVRNVPLRRHWPLALLLASLAIALLTGVGSPAFPPLAVVPLLAWGAVALFGWLTPNALRLGAVLAPLMGIAAAHRLLLPGMPDGHDLSPHLWGAYGYLQAVDAGAWLPRWNHHIGLGMPLTLFYPPLPFLLLRPFHLLGLPVYACLVYGMLLASALSGSAMYFAARAWTGRADGALVAAAAWCFAPYHLMDIQVRVAFAEVAAMAVLPIFFWAAARAVASPGRKTIAVAATWTGLLAATHPLSLSMAATGMGLHTLAAHGRRSPRALALLALIGLLGLGMAGAYTVPLFARSGEVTISSALGSGEDPLYGRHGLAPLQLVERRFWSRPQRSKPWGSPGSEMPFYLGITLLAVAPLAASKKSAPLLALAGGALLLTLHPFAQLLASFPPMKMLQYPWRFLGPATFGLAAAAAFALPRLERSVGRLAPAILMGVLLLDFWPYGGAPAWQDAWQGLTPASIDHFGLPLRGNRLPLPPASTEIDLSNLGPVYPEYFTPAVRAAFWRPLSRLDPEILAQAGVGLDLRGKRGHLEAVEVDAAPYAQDGAGHALPFTRGGGRIQVTLDQATGPILVREQAFPGWEAEVGGEAREIRSTDQGLMEIALQPADQGRLTLRFGRTLADWLGAALSAACLVGLWVSRRPRWRGGTPGRLRPPDR